MSALNHLAGLAAERSVCREYEAGGCVLAARRFRGASGEIDLVFHQGATVIFVEVKKSRSFSAASARLGAPQMRRILQTAAEYLGTCPDGQMTPARIDVALVNAMGEVALIENAIME